MAIELRRHNPTQEVTPYDLVAIQDNVEEALRSIDEYAGSGIASEAPPKMVCGFYLSASDVADASKFTVSGLGVGSYTGWAICNGSNGTPNLTARFIRLLTTAAGGTGGSDSSAHTHAVDPGSFTSGASSGHTHAVDPGSFTSGAGSAHSHASGTLAADISLNTGNIGADDTMYIRSDPTGFTYSHILTGGATSDPADGGVNDSVGTHGSTATESAHTHAIDVPSTTSGAESGHTHAIDVPSTTSGAASATENRPAYVELVPLMRI